MELERVSELYSEVLYKFSLKFLKRLSEIDESVEKIRESIGDDEVLETLVISPIATVFILNECLHYNKFNEEFPNEEKLNEIVDLSYDKFDNYMKLFISSKQTYVSGESKLTN